MKAIHSPSGFVLNDMTCAGDDLLFILDRMRVFGLIGACCDGLMNQLLQVKKEPEHI